MCDARFRGGGPLEGHVLKLSGVIPDEFIAIYSDAGRIVAGDDGALKCGTGASYQARYVLDFDDPYGQFADYAYRVDDKS